MENLDQITQFLVQYWELVVPLCALLLDFALRKVKSPKPLSFIDKGLDVAGLVLSKLKLAPAARLVLKIRELLNAVLPERLKPE